MPRLIGGALLMAAAVWIAGLLSGGEKRRVRLLEGFLLLVRHVRGQIHAFCTPLSEIYDTFSHRELEECGFLLALRTSDFSTALAQVEPSLSLDGIEIHALQAFGKSIGKGERESEVRLCDTVAAELERALQKRREELPRRTRVLQTMSISGGLMLLIMLL